MSTVFAINFRREAYQQSVARLRRRAAMLGMWLLYFGAVGVVLGLYGLNCASLESRTATLERQAARLRKTAGGGDEWRPGRTEAAEVERHLRDPRQWRDRLVRLPEVLPVNAQLTSLQFNPDNASGAADLKLVINGVLRGGAGQDRMQQVMIFVNALSRDSVFSAGYRNIRLVTTRASSQGDGAEFVIECR